MLYQLQEELKQAMKKGDKAAMIGFRNIIGKLKAAQIDKGEMLNEEECSMKKNIQRRKCSVKKKCSTKKILLRLFPR